MKTRVVREEEGFWRIRCGKRQISKEERDRLVKYFQKIRMPYRLVDSKLVVPASVAREDIFSKLEAFYDGEACVYPF